MKKSELKTLIKECFLELQEDRLLEEYDDPSLAYSKKELKSILKDIDQIWKLISRMDKSIKGAFRPGQAGTTLQWDKLYDTVGSKYFESVRYALEDFQESVKKALKEIK